MERHGLIRNLRQIVLPNYAQGIAIVCIPSFFHCPSLINASELEREANIARNRAILDELELKQAVADLGIPKTKATQKSKAKPVQPSKRVKRERSESDVPRRQSSRLKKGAVDPSESPAERKQREVRHLCGIGTTLTCQ